MKTLIALSIAMALSIANQNTYADDTDFDPVAASEAYEGVISWQKKLDKTTYTEAAVATGNYLWVHTAHVVKVISKKGGVIVIKDKDGNLAKATALSRLSVPVKEDDIIVVGHSSFDEGGESKLIIFNKVLPSTPLDGLPSEILQKRDRPRPKS